MHTIHKGLLTDQLEFNYIFPQLLPLIDLPMNLEWVYVTGQNISLYDSPPTVQG